MKQRIAGRAFVLVLVIALILTGCFGGGGSDSYNVSGRVVDPSGQGIADVTLNFSGGHGIATSDESGKWVKSGLTGTVTITAAKEGWTFESKVVKAAATDVEIIGYSSESSFSLSGRVLDENGSPLSGVEISFTAVDGTEAAESAISDQEGHWARDNIQTTVHVFAKLAGYSFSPGKFVKSVTEDDLRFIGVLEEEHHENIVLSKDTFVVPKSETKNMEMVSPDLIVFAEDTELTRSLEVGSIIVSDGDQPIMHKVVSVLDGGCSVQVEPAMLDEIIEDGEIVISQKISPEYVMENIAFADGFVVIGGRDGFIQQFRYPAEGDPILTGHFKIGLDSSLDFSLSFWRFDVNLEFLCDLDIDMDVHFLIESEQAWGPERKVVATILLPPIPIWGGLFLDPSINLVVGVEGKLTAKMEARASYNRTHILGTRYEMSRGWEKIQREAGPGFSNTQPYIEGTAEAKMYIGPEVRIAGSLVRVTEVGVEVGLYGFVGFDGEARGEVMSPNDFYYYYNLDGWLEGHLQFDGRIGLFDKKSPLYTMDFVTTTLAYGMSGKVTDEEGKGIQGIEIAISGKDSIYTNDSGYWYIPFTTGNVTITPKAPGYTFSPANREVSNGKNDYDFVVKEDDEDDEDEENVIYPTPAGYNHHDYQKLVAFLEIKDEKGVKNGEELTRFYDPQNPETWTAGFAWTDGEKKQISVIYIWSKFMDGPLDLSGCTALQILSCQHNHLTALDVSGCLALERLKCERSHLTSLNVGGCSSLERLFCDNNHLTSLDVSDCSALKRLECYNNYLTSLDGSGLVNLSHFNCSGNHLTSLDVSDCSALNSLWCARNQLTSLDVSDLTALAVLWCDRNQLISLNVGGCSSLERLFCHNNQLTTLDVSDCVNLEVLRCDPDVELIGWPR